MEERSGIYRLSYQKDEGFFVFYVGKTESLQDRLLDHLSDAEPNDCIKNKISNDKCKFRFAYVSREENRDCAERYLYDYYKPKCNTQTPTAIPCEINLN